MENNSPKNRKVWFITGASKGFGLELTKQLLATGHQAVSYTHLDVYKRQPSSSRPDAPVPLKCRVARAGLPESGCRPFQAAVHKPV